VSTLIRKRALAADEFVMLADDAPLPASGSVIVSLARWQKEGDTLRAGGLCTGVRIPNTADLAQVFAQIADRPVIALEYPAFPDGRAHSQARLLRDRYRYAGEVRATGAAVVRDHLQAMERCGIDAFLLRADQDVADCLAAFTDFTLAYQPATDDLPLVARLRGRA
jgi:uncharacterized protein (DUF934 family)